MKILILANNDGGLYHFRKDLIQELISNGNKIYVSVPFEKKIELLKRLDCELIDTEVDRRGINPLTDIKLVKEYFRILKSIKPDMVITYTIKPNIYGGFVCRLKKIPYCVNITGLGTAFQGDNWLKKFVVALYKMALKKVKTVFFENTENRDIFVANHIVPQEKTCTLNGAGVNIEEYTFSEYPQNCGTKFLFIGRVMKEKGIDELFEAMQRLKAEGYDCSLDMLGSFEDDYESKVDEMQKKRIINYHGEQLDVKPFIRKAHCFVLPSYHEGMANTLLECGAMGRPLITSNIHGCLEAVVDGKTGYLCDVKNSADLYDKMRKFMELSYDEKKEMGRLSHEYVAAKFDKRKVIEETVREIFK